MSDEGSPRPRWTRRALIAIARAIALLTLIIGINAVLAVALPLYEPLYRYLTALAAGVVIFELLRPPRSRPLAPAAEPALVAPDLTEAQRTIDELRAEAERIRSDAEARVSALTRDTQDLTDVNNALRQQTARSDATIAEMAEDLATTQRKAAAAAEEARSREAQIREQYEAESEHLQSAAGKALEEIQRTRAANDELRAEIERGRERAAAALRELEELRKKSDAVAAEHGQLESQLADFDSRLASALQELDGLRAERQRLQRDVEEARQRSEVEKAALRRSIEAEWGAKVQKIAGDLTGEHERAIGEAIADRDVARAESRTLSVTLHDLRRQLEAEQQTSQQRHLANEELARQIDEERQRFHGELEQQKAALETELDGRWSTKLQDMVNKLTADHENDVGEAIAGREEARAEARALRQRVQDLQQQFDLARDGRFALLQRDDELTQQLEAERRFSSELAESRARLDQENAALRTHLERLDADWNAKLQKIVAELTMDHENEIGGSLAAREAARAEARALNLRMHELEGQLQDARDGRLGLLQRDDEVTRQLDAERQTRERLEQENAALKAQLEERPAVDEKSLRERVEAEWSDKLQTIVSHIASDHESDIGKAIEEREAARAEARNLAIKVSSLQQKIDADRKAFTAAQEEWTAKIRATEEEMQSLRSTPPAAEPFPPPPSDDEERRARAEVLQFAEQAHEALRRVTSPGDVPLPTIEERRPRVLFVHHDPALRNMSRDNLSKSGFDVLTAADGLEGLRLAMANKPDVVIADASMPKMDGRELCQLIKSNAETAGVKVILMTGIYTSEVPMEVASREFEADELLRKPVKFEALKAALTNLLAARVEG